MTACVQKLDRSCIDKDGWFDTGDIALVDDNGQFIIKERASFVFKYHMRKVCMRKEYIYTKILLHWLNIYKIHPVIKFYRLTRVKLRQSCTSIRLCKWPA
jgi:acyl-CoA synthetase (AMP-forming)/AMP-acid ligase II